MNDKELEKIFSEKRYYALDENNNVFRADMNEWAKCFKKDTFIVKQEHIDNKFVSTVFLGIDHNFNLLYADDDKDEYKPHIFETMVFNEGEGREQYCDRYSTWKEAEEGHQRAIQWVKNGCNEEE